MNDEELKELFSAFDDVTATESLKSATLDFILAAAAAEETAEETTDESSEESSSSEVEVASETEEVEVKKTPVVVTAERGGRGRARNRWRVIRVAAIAACLVLALSGGVAYATSSSYVAVVSGTTSIEIGVNCFGYAVSSSSNDEVGQKVIDSTPNMLNVPYKDSVARVTDTLKKVKPEESIEIQTEDDSKAEALAEFNEQDASGTEASESAAGGATGRSLNQQSGDGFETDESAASQTKLTAGAAARESKAASDPEAASDDEEGEESDASAEEEQEAAQESATDAGGSLKLELEQSAYLIDEEELVDDGMELDFAISGDEEQLDAQQADLPSSASDSVDNVLEDSAGNQVADSEPADEVSEDADSSCDDSSTEAADASYGDGKDQEAE